MAEANPGIVILGGGGHARVLAEAIVACSLTLAGHVAPKAADQAVMGRWLGDDDALAGLVAMGHGLALGLGFVDAKGAERRGNLVRRWEDALVTVIHPSAHVSPSAQLSPGVFVAVGAVVGTGTQIGAGSIVNSGAVVDHDAQIGANVHIATGARLAGGVTVGRDVLVGLGALLRQGVTIGDGAVIGAGAVVVGDVAPSALMLGVPARAVAGRNG